LITLLLWAATVTVVVVVVALKALDAYTLHNRGVLTPDVRGMQPEEAAKIFRAKGLRCVTADSVFSIRGEPGVVVETSPAAGAKVKPGRLVLLTVNSQTSRTGVVPAVKDLSLRQAYALLRARGFMTIEITYVPGAYRDLITAVEADGQPVEEGDRIAFGARMVLKVSDGTSPDSVEMAPPDTMEQWF